jgi:hypothetical protein
MPLATGGERAHICKMDTKTNPRLPLPKIDQLVDDAKKELKRVGIETEGKRSHEILKMAREERISRARQDKQDVRTTPDV